MKRNTAFILVLLLVLVVGGVYYFSSTGDLQGRLTQKTISPLIQSGNTPQLTQPSGQSTTPSTPPPTAPTITVYDNIVWPAEIVPGNIAQILGSFRFEYPIGSSPRPFIISGLKITFKSTAGDGLLHTNGALFSQNYLLNARAGQSFGNIGSLLTSGSDTTQTVTLPNIEIGGTADGFNPNTIVQPYSGFVGDPNSTPSGDIASGSNLQVCITNFANATCSDPATGSSLTCSFASLADVCSTRITVP